MQQIHEFGIDELKPYEKNPRRNDESVQYVANSIKEFGFKVPIVIDKEKVIVAGHTRYKAAKKLGLSKVPCIVADDLTEAQIKAFRLADNKVGEFSEWDMELLGNELGDLSNIFDMSAFGFLPDANEPTGDDNDFDADKVAEEIVDPVSEPGNLFILGGHRLVCGDSCDESTIRRLCGDSRIDLYLTDPPYNVNYKGGTKKNRTILNDNMNSEKFLAFLTDAFVAADSALKPGGAFYIWHASNEVVNFCNAIKNVPGWMPKEYLIWVKNRFVLGRQDYQNRLEPCWYGWKDGAAHYFITQDSLDYQWRHEPCWYGWKDGAAHYFIDDRKQSTVLEFDKPNKSKLHPTMKPVELFELLISNSSHDGENVLNSFGGSGTTIIACEKTGRHGFASELDPKFCDVIVERWINLTKKEAYLLRDDGIKVPWSELKAMKGKNDENA